MSSQIPLRSTSSSSGTADSCPQEQSDDFRTEKTEHILAACHHQDISSLVQLATSSKGLINDNLRRTSWPILLGCDEKSPNELPSWRTLPPHQDEEQAAKDVNRAFVYYPKESDSQLDRRKEELSDIIVEVLRRYPSLCYFQGFHDIVQVLYLVLGPNGAPPALARLSLLRIRDYMLPTLRPAIQHLQLLPAILKAGDPVLYNHLPKVPPDYALGATLTLFSHVIEEYTDITRLFDFFLASDTAIPVYFFASLLISRREELLAIEKDEDESIFFVMLGKLPQPFDLEDQILQTMKLFERVPPESLGSPWWYIHSASVLKAGRTPFDAFRLSLDDGQALFKSQERRVRVIQAYDRAILFTRRTRFHMWRHRRRGAFCLSLVVGFYALWLGRQHSAGPLGNLFRRVMGVIIP